MRKIINEYRFILDNKFEYSRCNARASIRGDFTSAPSLMEKIDRGNDIPVRDRRNRLHV